MINLETTLTHDVHQAFKWLQIIARLFGILPLCPSLIGTIIFSIWSSILFFGLFVLYSFNFKSYFRNIWSINSVDDYVVVMWFLVIYFCYVVETLFFISKQSMILAEVENLREVDGQLEASGFAFFYSANHNWVMISLLLTAIFSSFSDVLMCVKGDDCRVMNIFTQLTPWIVFQIINAYWYAFVKVVGDHFAHLIESMDLPHVRNSSTQLVKLAQIHLKLFKISGRINDIFGPHLFCTVVSSFFNITILNFTLVRSYFTSGQEAINSKSVSEGFAIYMMIHSLWVVITVAEKTRDKAHVFHNVLYKLMVDDKSGEVTNDPKIQIHISMKNQIKFTAWGFLRLDFTLLQAMIGTSATVIVILLQFDLARGHNCISDNNGTCPCSSTQSPFNSTI